MMQAQATRRIGIWAVAAAALASTLAVAKAEGADGILSRVDLVSYSAWDTRGDPKLLRSALQYIARHTLDREPFGDRNVYIGEFGLPENDFPPSEVKRAVRNTITTALDWGCPYVVYWQLYCNEARRRPVQANDDVRGFWLIRPDGSRGVAWAELHGLLSRRVSNIETDFPDSDRREAVTNRLTNRPKLPRAGVLHRD